MNKHCLIGLGFISNRHIQAIEETGGKVVLTCDIDKNKNADFTDWRKMYDSKEFKEIDYVSVLTPNYLHAEMCREAIKRGKKVICEKPLCIDPKDIEGLEKVNPILQLRYSPKVIAAKNKEPYRVTLEIVMVRDDSYFNGWKYDKEKSGGLLFNLGIHYIDLLIYLLGDFVQLGDNMKIEDGYSFGGHFARGRGDLTILLAREGTPQRRMEISYCADTCKKEETIDLSSKPNLSEENLHTLAYEQIIKGNGISIKEVTKSIKLAHYLTHFNQ